MVRFGPSAVGWVRVQRMVNARTGGALFQEVSTDSPVSLIEHVHVHVLEHGG